MINLHRARESQAIRKWIVPALFFIPLFLIILFAAAAPALSSMARSRIQSALQDRFASDLQIQNFKVSLFPSVAISGDSVVFHRKGHPGDPPLIQIARITATGNILGLLARHVSLVHLEGLDIRIPPKGSGTAGTSGGGKIPYFVIDEIIADGTRLSTIPRDNWKEPLGVCHQNPSYARRRVEECPVLQRCIDQREATG